MNGHDTPGRAGAEPEKTLTVAEALALAIQLHRGGRLAEAEHIYRQVLQRDPEQADALHYLGLLSHQLGRGQGAIDLITKAIALAPAYADARNNLGNVLKEQGRLDEAAAAFLAVIALIPNHVAARNNLGVIYKAQGKTEAAILAYEQALVFEPDYVEARYNLANALASQSKIEAAIGAYQKVIALKPDHVDAYCALGHIYQRQDRLVEAATAFRKAVAIRPNHPQASFDLANVLNRNGLFTAAVEAYRQAIICNPACAKAYENLGNVLNLLGKTSETVEVWERWLKQEPQNPIPIHMLAAATGRAVPLRAADEYVKQTFDWFADTFEERLAQLEYRAPALLAESLALLVQEQTLVDPGKAATTSPPTAEGFFEKIGRLDILDAGCGTGLCGPLLRPYARQLVGVDLSPAMLEKARACKIYDELIAAELTEFLTKAAGAYDVIVSADTLVYFGDLQPVLTACRHALRFNGTVIFTLEDAGTSGTEAGYFLHPLGRYTHTVAYVQRSLSAAGLSLRSLTFPNLRKENGSPVAGMLVWAASGTADAPTINK